METSEFLKSVVEQTSTFADWVHGKDPSTPVPTCPKWTLADLVNHVGGTQRMVATLVGERLTDPSRAFASEVPAPTDPAQWRAWLTDNAADAKQAFDSVADDTPVWERTHAEADVAVRGPATDLLLVICRRRSLDAAPALDVQGDRALLDRWIEHMDWVTD
jgi:hypothetical protein